MNMETKRSMSNRKELESKFVKSAAGLCFFEIPRACTSVYIGNFTCNMYCLYDKRIMLRILNLCAMLPSRFVQPECVVVGMIGAGLGRVRKHSPLPRLHRLFV